MGEGSGVRAEIWQYIQPMSTLEAHGIPWLGTSIVCDSHSPPHPRPFSPEDGGEGRKVRRKIALRNTF